MKNDYVVFILTFGRANNIKTLRSLKSSGYTGEIYFICSDDDKSLEEYKKKFKDKVIVFNKDSIDCDRMDNFKIYSTILFARNFCYTAAKKIGYKYFIQLDDDYSSWAYRFNSKLEWRCRKIKSLDKIFNSYFNFFKKTPFKTVAMAQPGDFIGGGENGSFGSIIQLKRKAMNVFFCDVDRPVKFRGTMNEDVNTYTKQQNIGDLFCTLPICAITQELTQQSGGGITDMYLEYGTYVKSFYTVIQNPSSVKVGEIRGQKNTRLHHSVNWKLTVPKIVKDTTAEIIS